jgi:arylsulfatase A-like enzyme
MARFSNAPRLAVVVVAVALLASSTAAATPPHVIVLLIDGLGADRISPDLTPTLWSLGHDGKERATFYTHAAAAMPSVTNANHASIATGLFPAAHGIVGNHWWDGIEPPVERDLDASSLVEAETIFTVACRASPSVATAAVFGKWKLAELFGATSRQCAPTHLWGDVASQHELPDPRTGPGSDERTMDEVLRTISFDDPRFVFVALGDVDRVSHVYGPKGHEARKAILEADRQLRRLVKSLKASGIWPDTVLIVTADHGFASVEPDAKILYPMVSFGEELDRRGIGDAFVVSNGAVASVYLRPGAKTKDEARLKAIRQIAIARRGIAEALYRAPNAADGGEEHTVDRTHPDWRFASPRAGDLLVVAVPGYFFDDPYGPATAAVRGMHGGPDTREIPILVTGGAEGIRTQVVDSASAATNPDVGATALWLLGLRPARRLDGRAIPDSLSGRVLREAFER